MFAAITNILKQTASFVCAVLSSNTRACLLRSYENIGMPELLYDSCKIWEACRATCAATRFFDPITIGPYQQRFVDGAFQHNNPISMVYREASYLWPSRVEDAVLVSTGTGRAPAPVLEGNIIDVMDALKNIALETESTADDFFADHRSMASKDLLYRFNAYPGLTEVGLDEYNQSRKIADATHAYMSTGETRRQWENCLQKLRNDDCNKNMYDAIEKGDLSRLKEALEEGADIEADNGKPLRNASLKGHAGMVKILLCRGAAINSQGETKQTALHIAAALGNTAAIAVLLEHGPNVDARDIDELTALHYVCSIGNEEIAKLLLDYRADIEAISDPNNMTPLQVAASLGSAQLVKLLLDRGANINALGNPGQSALQWAVVFGHKSVLEILLDHKPNVNMRNNQFIGEWKDGIEEIFEVDLMPLHSAAYFGDGPMVRTLLDHGAHINATTGAKHHLQHFRTTTSLHLAMLCHHTSAARATHTATVALLIERGADLRAKDFEGYTPLERGERVANKENHPAKHIAAALTSLLREALSRKH